MPVYNGVVLDKSLGGYREELNGAKIKDIFNNLDKKLKEPAGVNNYDQFNQGRYNFLHPHRGVVLMIINTGLDGEEDSEYENDLLSQDGQRMKDVLLKSPFNYMYGHFISFKNVTFRQMKLIFDSASKLEGLKNCSSFIFHFSGHGSMNQDEHEFIKDYEGIPFDIATICHYFSDNKCKGLQGKPKIFFIDACRYVPDKDPLLDKGVLVATKSKSMPDSLFSSHSRQFESGSRPGNQPVDNFKILCPTNFLIVNSCVKYQGANPQGLISTVMGETYSDYGSYEEIDLMEFMTFASMKLASGYETWEPDGTNYTNTRRLLPVQHRLLAGVVYKATNTN